MEKKRALWKAKIHEIIYEADSPNGKLFDVILLWMILGSVFLVIIESIPHINKEYSAFFNVAEWIITIFFTIEYVFRIISVDKPIKYITSFYGIIDLLATLPKYLSYFIPGAFALTTLRALRLLRVFRVLKLVRFMGASDRLVKALKASRAKIAVFLYAVIILIVLLGTLMYLIEGKEHGFVSIPKSIYWAVVTLTTVGYGDISPGTPLGQFVASIVMILGYGIIAVPTGIVTSELSQKPVANTEHCPSCMEDKHLEHSNYCHRCGTLLKDS
ncbi:ion transporter [Flavobacteriaceae bacterium]|nr:ion transporter [Flavobacteriaceae bacterium]